MAFKRLNQEKVDIEKWNEYLKKRHNSRERIRIESIDFPQADGSSVLVTPFDLVKELDELDQDFRKLFCSWLD